MVITAKHSGDQLKPFHWKPGQSGNPKGRPKKEYNLTSLLKQRFDDPGMMQRVIDAWIKMVETLQFPALKEMLDRLEGKVTERHEIDARLPVTLVFQPVLAPGRDAPQRLSNENLGVLPPDAVDDMPLALDVGKEGQDFDLTEQNEENEAKMEVELSENREANIDVPDRETKGNETRTTRRTKDIEKGQEIGLPNPAALGGCLKANG